MSDQQLHERAVIRRLLIVSALLLLLSGGIAYFWFTTEADITGYRSEKSREESLQRQVESLQQTNITLTQTIEETGLELVSFSEDKIRYINLASSLALKHGVDIGKLTVSDVWDEGQMSGMTTTVEVSGSLEAIKNFINEYCSARSTNRINVISLRSIDSYKWLTRSVEDNSILTWVDLTEEERKQIELEAALEQERNQLLQENGILPSQVNNGGISEERQPITLTRVFTESDFRIYLEIDFLGRA